MDIKIENHKIVTPKAVWVESKKNTGVNAKPFNTKDKLPDSVIIHYTAGRSADSSAKYLSKDGVEASAHLVIGQQGEIYQLVPFNCQSWHAGKSSYGGRNYYNQYSIGIEIDNAGPLTKTGSQYQAWFGTNYNENEVIRAANRNSTQLQYWKTYTQAQIETVYAICQALKTEYGIKEILGHEEIAPTRKQDPGPAFPLDKMRNQLLHSDRGDVEDEATKVSGAGTVVASTLNIRSNAGSQYDKVAKPLPNGQEVEILEELNGWYKVSTKIEGWVSKAYIQKK